MDLDYRTLLGAFPDAVVVADDENRIVYANAAAERLLGWSICQLAGMPLTCIQPPRLRTSYAVAFQHHRESGEFGCPGPQLQVPALRQDGSELDVEISLATIPVGGDRHIFVLSLRDVSARVALQQQEEQERQQLELTGAITEHLSDAVCALDRHGRIVFVNPAGERILGWTEDELVGRNIHDVAHGADANGHDHGKPCPLLAAALGDETSRVEDDVFRRKDGTAFPVAYAASPLQAGAHGARRVLTVQDMTERRQAEASFRLLFASSPLPMWVYDLETLRFLEVNEAALRAYGYTRDEFLAMRIVDLPPRADVPQLIDLLLGSPERLEHVHEWRHRLKDGQVIDVEVTAHRVPFGGREAAMVLAQDITERKRLAEDLRHRALHDVLTDLPNRVLFGDRLAHSLRTAHRDHEPLALLFMDLDRFKEVNDTLGHQCGDVLLQETARRIRSVLRESDTVARLGGDEFAVLLPTTDSQGAKEAARKILGSLEQPFFLEDLLIPIGASIGIALYPYHGRDADSLIRRADAAMYMAKRARAGYATFVPEHEPALVEWPLAAGA